MQFTAVVVSFFMSSTILGFKTTIGNLVITICSHLTLELSDWKRPTLEEIPADINFTKYPAIHSRPLRLVQTENAKPIILNKKSPSRVSPSRTSPSHSTETSLLQSPSSIVTG